MSYGMYVSALGAEAQSRRLQMISNNMANASTPGFKRELAIIQERSAEAIEQGLDYPERESLNNIGGGIRMDESLTDYSLGTIKKTDMPTDVALEDPDTFFVVEKDGKPHLTRAGNFRLTAQGDLVTQDGLPVLDRGGAPIQIQTDQPFRFLSHGVLDQPSGTSELAIVRSNSPADLVRVGSNMFQSLAPTEEANPTQRQIRPGFVEQSAVRPALEMMEMIQTTRAYEANVRMIQNNDTVTGQLLGRVLKQ